KSTRIFVPVGGHVQNLRVTRVDNDVIHKQSRPIEVHQQSPILATIRRRIKLTVQSSNVKAIRIFRVDDEGAHVSTGWPGDAPLSRIGQTRSAAHRRGLAMTTRWPE